MVFTDSMRAIIQKELSDKLKSKWVIIIAAGLAVFTIIISYFGGATSGAAGFRDMDMTVASLASLATYFIPILALTLGGGIIADEYDRGTLELYLSAPLSIGEFIAGKFLGLGLALVLSTVGGFGLGGIILVINLGLSTAASYLIFMLNSVALGLMFLSVSFLASVFFTERAKVIAFTVFLWIFYTLIYDLGLIGILILTGGIANNEIFSALLILNPVDVYRIMNFLSIGKLNIFIGLASLDLPSYMKSSVLWFISLLWIILPLIISYRFFKKRHLA